MHPFVIRPSSLVILLLLPLLARAQAPATQPNVITGTIGKQDDAGTIDRLGHAGVLFIRSEARWNQFLARLGEERPLNAELPKFDFTKQSVVFLYRTVNRRADTFSLDRADLAAKPPQLGFGLTWDNSGEEQRESRFAKFILALVPATPSANVTLHSRPRLIDGEPHPNLEFESTLSDNAASDTVDNLQATLTPKAATIKPGEDIRLDFVLHPAEPTEAHPQQFQPEPGNSLPIKIFVWDGKYSNGYRNHAFFVTTPDGKATLLRAKVINAWDKNAPHAVEITAKQPYRLPNWADDKGRSLKDLGLDTAAPGTYTITGLYEETGGGNGPTPLWGGSITTNTVRVEVKK